MLELQEALRRIAEEINPLASETVALGQSAGRYSAEPVVSPMDLPRFDNSAMDGYAVRPEDVAGASPESPVALRLAGRVAAGEVYDGRVESGACVRVFTGSPIPQGAEAVIMQEDTLLDATRPGEVNVLDEVKAWQNIRFRGEDVKRGQTLIEAGQKLTAGRLALLGAVGVTHVSVGRRPVVGVLATGTELVEPGSELAPGQIYESNRLALATLVAHTGAETILMPLVADSLEATRSALREAFDRCDVVLTSGGVSVGELDFVKEAIQELGGVLSFWRVAVKPGKPFVFGRSGEKPFFGLPGNPVSALVTFVLLVRPALLRLQSAGRLELPSHPGILLEPLVNRGDRVHFVRVLVDNSGGVRSAGVQASHVLGSLARANGLVAVAAGESLEKGANVRVLRWEDLEG